MTRKVSTTFFDFSHLRVGTKVSPASGTTFGLYIKNGLKNSDKPLFTGHVEKGMGTQLRRIAGHFDELEDALRQPRRERTMSAHVIKLPSKTKRRAATGEKLFYIIKNGMMFRPNYRGYTSSELEAGQYTAKQCDSYRSQKEISFKECQD